MPLAWGAAGVAAVISAVVIMFKGGIVNKPRRHALAAGGGSADGRGIPDLGGDDDAPRRYPLPTDSPPVDRESGGPRPTQTETGVMMAPADWGGPDGEPSISYDSPGDGGAGAYSSGDSAAVSSQSAVAARSAGHPGTGGGGYQAPFSPAVEPSFSGGYSGGFVPYVAPGSSPTPIATQAGNYYVPGSGGLHIS